MTAFSVCCFNPGVIRSLGISVQIIKKKYPKSRKLLKRQGTIWCMISRKVKNYAPNRPLPFRFWSSFLLLFLLIWTVLRSSVENETRATLEQQELLCENRRMWHIQNPVLQCENAGTSTQSTLLLARQLILSSQTQECTYVVSNQVSTYVEHKNQSGVDKSRQH